MNKVERAEYMKERYRKWKARAIELLGGECVVCGSKEGLELDHINREDKSFMISRLWSYSQEMSDYELLKKCQLLCYVCHKAKTSWERK